MAENTDKKLKIELPDGRKGNISESNLEALRSKFPELKVVGYMDGSAYEPMTKKENDALPKISIPENTNIMSNDTISKPTNLIDTITQNKPISDSVNNLANIPSLQEAKENEDIVARRYAEQQLTANVDDAYDRISKMAEPILENASKEQVKRNTFDTENKEGKSFFRRLAEFTGNIAPRGGNRVNFNNEAYVTNPEVRAVSTAMDLLDDSKKLIKDVNNDAGLLTGAARKTFDIDTWTAGVSQGLKDQAVLSALDKYESGKELTESEDALLEAMAINTAVAELFTERQNIGYYAGTVTAESIPFMLEMLANPASGFGRVTSKRIAQYAIKKGMGRAATRALSYGGRLAADIVGSNMMALSTGSGRVVAGALDRQLGNVNYVLDDDGAIKFTGISDNGDSFMRSLAKSYGSTVITNLSEMLGAYFAPLTGLAGNQVGKFLKHFPSLKKVENILEMVKNDDLVKLFSDFDKELALSGPFGEFTEEIADQLMQGIIVDEKGVKQTAKETFNKDNLIKTFVGVSVLGGVRTATRTVALARHGFDIAKMYRDKAEGQMRTSGLSEEDANRYKDLANDACNDSKDDYKKLRDFIKDVSSSNLTVDQQVAILNYVKSVQKAKGIELTTRKARRDGVDTYDYARENNTLEEPIPEEYIPIPEEAPVAQAQEPEISDEEKVLESFGLSGKNIRYQEKVGNTYVPTNNVVVVEFLNPVTKKKEIGYLSSENKSISGNGADTSTIWVQRPDGTYIQIRVLSSNIYSRVNVQDSKFFADEAGKLQDKAIQEQREKNLIQAELDKQERATQFGTPEYDEAVYNSAFTDGKLNSNLTIEQEYLVDRNKLGEQTASDNIFHEKASIENSIAGDMKKIEKLKTEFGDTKKIRDLQYKIVDKQQRLSQINDLIQKRGLTQSAPVAPAVPATTTTPVTPEATAPEVAPEPAPELAPEPTESNSPTTEEDANDEVDYDKLLSESPVKFIEKMTEEFGEEVTNQQVANMVINLDSEIDKLNKKLDKETSPNKMVATLKKINELKKQREGLASVMKTTEAPDALKIAETPDLKASNEEGSKDEKPLDEKPVGEAPVDEEPIPEPAPEVAPEVAPEPEPAQEAPKAGKRKRTSKKELEGDKATKDDAEKGKVATITGEEGAEPDGKTNEGDAPDSSKSNEEGDITDPLSVEAEYKGKKVTLGKLVESYNKIKNLIDNEKKFTVSAIGRIVKGNAREELQSIRTFLQENNIPLTILGDDSINEPQKAKESEEPVDEKPVGEKPVDEKPEDEKEDSGKDDSTKGGASVIESGDGYDIVEIDRNGKKEAVAVINTDDNLRRRVYWMRRKLSDIGKELAALRAKNKSISDEKESNKAALGEVTRYINKVNDVIRKRKLEREIDELDSQLEKGYRVSMDEIDKKGRELDNLTASIESAKETYDNIKYNDLLNKSDEELQQVLNELRDERKEYSLADNTQAEYNENESKIKSLEAQQNSIKSEITELNKTAQRMGLKNTENERNGDKILADEYASSSYGKREIEYYDSHEARFEFDVVERKKTQKENKSGYITEELKKEALELVEQIPNKGKVLTDRTQKGSTASKVIDGKNLIVRINSNGVKEYYYGKKSSPKNEEFKAINYEERQLTPQEKDFSKEGVTIDSYYDFVSAVRQMFDINTQDSEGYADKEAWAKKRPIKAKVEAYKANHKEEILKHRAESTVTFEKKNTKSDEEKAAEKAAKEAMKEAFKQQRVGVNSTGVTNTRKATVSEVQTLSKAIAAVFPRGYANVKILSDKKFNQVRAKFSGKPIHNDDGAVCGFIGGDGVVYINQDKARIDTPLHEIGIHKLMDLARETGNTALRDAVYKYAKTAPRAIMDEVRKMYPNLDPNSNDGLFLEEVAAMAFGLQNEGRLEAMLQTEAEKTWWKKLVEAVKNLWNKITKTEPTYKDMSLYQGLSSLGHEEIGNKLFDMLTSEGTINLGQINRTGEYAYRDMFVGERAMGHNDRGLVRAKEMDAIGEEPLKIKQETGWEKGTDGKWRFELQDIKVKDSWFEEVRNLSKEERKAKVYTIDDVFEDSEELRLLKDRYYKVMGRISRGGRVMEGLRISGYNDDSRDISDRALGYYNPGTNKLMININHFSTKDKFKEMMLTAVHEIQHLIQLSEGFAVGGNLNTVEDLMVKDMEDDVNELEEQKKRKEEELENDKEYISLREELDILQYGEEGAAKKRQHRLNIKRWKEVSKILYNIADKQRELEKTYSEIFTGIENLRIRPYSIFRNHNLEGHLLIMNKGMDLDEKVIINDLLSVGDFSEEERILIEMSVENLVNLYNDYETLREDVEYYDEEYNELDRKIRDFKSPDLLPFNSDTANEVRKIENKIKDIKSSPRYELDKLEDRIQEFRGIIDEVKFENYKAIAGEVESRNVSKRMDYTPEQRRNSLASSTEETPRNQQYVIFYENGNASYASLDGEQSTADEQFSYNFPSNDELINGELTRRGEERMQRVSEVVANTNAVLNSPDCPASAHPAAWISYLKSKGVMDTKGKDGLGEHLYRYLSSKNSLSVIKREDLIRANIDRGFESTPFYRSMQNFFKDLGVNIKEVIAGGVTWLMDSDFAARRLQEGIKKKIGVKNLDINSDFYKLHNTESQRIDAKITYFNNNIREKLRNAYKAFSKYNEAFLNNQNIGVDFWKAVDKYLFALHASERNRHINLEKLIEEAMEHASSIKVSPKADLRALVSQWITSVYDNHFDLNNNVPIVMLSDIIDPKWKTQAQKLEKFMADKIDAIKMDNNQTGEQMSDIDALSYINEFESIVSIDEIDELINARNATTEFILDEAVNTGIISRDTYNIYRNQYKHYIPLRDFDNEETLKAKRRHNESSHRTTGSVTGEAEVEKKATGRQSDAATPLATLVTEAQDTIIRGEKNITLQALANLYRNNVAETSDMIYLSEYENIEDDTLAPEWVLETSKMDSPEGESHTIGLKINGKPMKLYLFGKNGNDIVTSYKNLQRLNSKIQEIDGNNAFSGIYNMGVKSLNAISAFTKFISRAYTTYSPEFWLLSNMPRDIRGGLRNTFIYRDAGYVKDVISGLSGSVVDILKAKFGGKVSPEYESFLNNGGAISFYQQISNEDVIEEAKREAQEYIARGMKEKTAYIKAFKNHITDFASITEEMMRYTAFKTAISRGEPAAEAAFFAHEVTTNLARRGTQLNFSRFWSFFNPTMQGIYQFLSDLYYKNTRGKGIAAHSATVALAIPSTMLKLWVSSILFNNWLDDDDDDKDEETRERLQERKEQIKEGLKEHNNNKEGVDIMDPDNPYWDIPEYVRANSTVIPIGIDKNGIPQVITIQNPHNYRILSSITEFAIENATGRTTTEEFVNKSLKRIIAELSPFDMSGYKDGVLSGIAKTTAPTFAKPWIDVHNNSNAFGDKIHREKYDDNTPEYLMAKGSSVDPYIKLSRWLNDKSGGSAGIKGSVQVNPDDMKYIVEAYLGPAAQLLHGAMNENNRVDAEKERYGDSFAALYNSVYWENRDGAMYQSTEELREATNKYVERLLKDKYPSRIKEYVNDKKTMDAIVDDITNYANSLSEEYNNGIKELEYAWNVLIENDRELTLDRQNEQLINVLDGIVDVNTRIGNAFDKYIDDKMNSLEN